MSNSARRHIERLFVAKRLYIGSPDGLSDSAVAVLLRVSRYTAYRYRLELSAVRVSPGRYSLDPSADDILLAHTILLRVDGANPHRPARRTPRA